MIEIGLSLLREICQLEVVDARHQRISWNPGLVAFTLALVQWGVCEGSFWPMLTTE